MKGFLNPNFYALKIHYLHLIKGKSQIFSLFIYIDIQFEGHTQIIIFVYSSSSTVPMFFQINFIHTRIHSKIVFNEIMYRPDCQMRSKM